MSDLAQKFYNALETYKSFNDYGNNKTLFLSYSSIVHTAIDPNTDKAIKNLEKINTSLSLRRQYRKVLNDIAFSYSPKQAAASTEAVLLERKNDEFTMVIEASEQKDSVLIHLMLSGTAEKDASHLNMHCFYEDVILPLTVERQSQKSYSTLLSTKNFIYKAITNADCEIFIN